jgi:hypothetical protein
MSLLSITSLFAVIGRYVQVVSLRVADQESRMLKAAKNVELKARFATDKRMQHLRESEIKFLLRSQARTRAVSERVRRKGGCNLVGY